MKYAMILVTLLALVGCQTVQPQQVEMPYSDNLESSDQPRVSPCACVEYTEFNDSITSA